MDERAYPHGLGILGLLHDSRHLGPTEARSMAQLIPSLATLVAAFSDCFHPQVFQTFQALLAGWITCQGPRTI